MAETIPCPDCQGSGTATFPAQSTPTFAVGRDTKTCPTCKGEGSVIAKSTTATGIDQAFDWLPQGGDPTPGEV